MNGRVKQGRHRETSPGGIARLLVRRTDSMLNKRNAGRHCDCVRVRACVCLGGAVAVVLDLAYLESFANM